jgi:hypothetical protein
LAVQPEVKQPEVKPEVKPDEKKKKVIKKVIKYVEKSDTEDETEEEEVIVKKPSKKKSEPIEIPQQQKTIEKTYNDLLYESSLERMQNKIMNERAKHLITAVIPNYG